MQLLYSELALLDIEQMWLEVYMASMDMETADAYRAGLKDAVRDKLAFPQSGAPLLRNGERTEYYYIVYKKYIAFYEIEGETMRVVRVLYRGMDRMKRLFPMH